MGMITFASAGFGAVMGMFMSSFEFNSSMQVDTDRSTRSQLKQHFHGYSRFLKRQALHFARFGLYISLCELPLELIIGKVNTPAIFIAGGLAAAFQNRWIGIGSSLNNFMGSGMFIGALGLYMHKGHD